RGERGRQRSAQRLAGRGAHLGAVGRLAAAAVAGRAPRRRRGPRTARPLLAARLALRARAGNAAAGPAYLTRPVTWSGQPCSTTNVCVCVYSPARSVTVYVP